MTVAELRAEVRTGSSSAFLVALAGCLALAARPQATWVAFAVTVAVGIASAIVAVPREGSAPSAQTVLITVAAIAAFAAIRFAAVVPRAPATSRYLAMLVFAAVAQELFFRRFLYALLAQRSASVAIAVTAVLFAVVHVPAYGLGAFPIDLAAGLVFGWQRWASGSWVSPAVSHTAANLMAIL